MRFGKNDVYIYRKIAKSRSREGSGRIESPLTGVRETGVFSKGGGGGGIELPRPGNQYYYSNEASVDSVCLPLSL